MPRILRWGAPDRKNRYLVPGSPGRGVLLGSLAAGGAIAAGVLLLNFAGAKRMASPGPLASPHAPLDSRCEHCHSQRTTLDLRCERCHDPAGSEAWRLSAHARFAGDVSSLPLASQTAKKQLGQNPLACAECHIDHRGRRFVLHRVSDLMCARCHGADTPSLKRHVEFAVVRGKATPSRGLKISHDRHVLEALARLVGKTKADDLTPEEKKKGTEGAALQRTCETCHVSTSDQTTFEPIDFDRHCSACHLKDGSVGATDPIAATDVVAAEKVPASWAASASGQFSVQRNKLAKSVLLHRDPWVLFNLAKLRRELDPAGYLAERNALLLAVDEGSRSGQSFPLSRASGADVDTARQALSTEVAALARRIASAPEKADAAALAAGLAPFTAAAAKAAPADASALKDAAAGVTGKLTGGLAPLSAAEAAARRAELLSALDGLRYRAVTSGDVLLGRRVEEIARRVAAWRPGATGSADLKQLLEERRTESQRLDDEVAYRREARDQWVPPVSRVKNRRALEARARDARQRLEALAAVDALPAAALDDASRASRVNSADSLTVACQKCHEVKSAALASLAIDLPVMPQSFFDHRPHVRLRPCGACHAEKGQGVLTSKKATDVLVPGVASCRQCHGPAEARADCVTCHRFHPSGYPDRGELRQPATALQASRGNPSGFGFPQAPSAARLVTSFAIGAQP